MVSAKELIFTICMHEINWLIVIIGLMSFVMNKPKVITLRGVFNIMTFLGFFCALGNSRQVISPSEGAQLFMEREFREILDQQTTPHPVVFIPETFLFDSIPSKVIFTYVKYRENHRIKSSVLFTRVKKGLHPAHLHSCDSLIEYNSCIPSVQLLPSSIDK